MPIVRWAQRRKDSYPASILLIRLGHVGMTCVAFTVLGTSPHLRSLRGHELRILSAFAFVPVAQHEHHASPLDVLARCRFVVDCHVLVVGEVAFE